MAGAAMELLKALCSLSSMFMNLSPSPSMYRIYKSKSCGEVQVLPLLSLWGSCHIWCVCIGGMTFVGANVTECE